MFGYNLYFMLVENVLKMNRIECLIYCSCFPPLADYTLWPFWVDTHVDPPFSKNKYV